VWTKEGESEKVKRVKDGNKETGPDPESPVTCNRPSLPRTRSLLLFCPTSPRSLHSLSLSPLSCWTAPSLSSLSRPNVCLHLACGPGGHASGRDAVHRQHLEQDRARAVHGKRHPRGSSCVADKATVKQTTAEWILAGRASSLSQQRFSQRIFFLETPRLDPPSKRRASALTLSAQSDFIVILIG